MLQALEVIAVVEAGGRTNTVSSEDAAILSRLRAGEEAAFMELVRRYQRYLMTLVGTFVSSRSVAEEVVQDTWLGVLEGIHAFEGRSSLKTWITRIAMNRGRTRGERESRSVTFSALADREMAEGGRSVEPERFMGPNSAYPGHWSAKPQSWEASPEKELMEQETFAVVQQAIDRLPEVQRLVISMRDMNDMDAEEVCNVLGLSETNQRVLLHRARSRVRAALESHYSTRKCAA